MKKLLWALLIVAIGLPGVTLGTMIHTEDFSYAPGTLLTATGNWANHSGTSNYIPVASPGLTYPGYLGSGIGEAASMLTTGEDVHTTAVWSVNSGTVYMAFLVNFSNAQAAGDYFTHYYQASTSFYGRVFAKLVGGAINFGISRASTSTVNYSATPFSLNQTHLVVLKYTFNPGANDDGVDLFVNPTLGGAEPLPLVSATDATSADATNIIAIALRQGSSSNAPTQYVDGFRVGTTWEDVAGGAPPPTGACCMIDGSCVVVTADNCAAWGGWYMGDGTTCGPPNPCPQPPGACCFLDGTCDVLAEGSCGSLGGIFQGGGTTCDPNPCPQPGQGACCFADGSCTILTAAECAAQAGAYQGDNTSCSPNPCPQPATGACCASSGACTVLTAAECAAAGGTYQGDNTLCSPNPCPFPFRTLCEVAADNADGTPQLLGQLVEVEGIAHVASGTWSTTSQNFEISDGSCCVNIFGGPINPAVAVGDRVRVRGTVAQFNGLTEVSTPELQVTILSSGNPVYGPGAPVPTADLELNGEQYEACLVQVECASITSGTWPASGSNGTLTIDDGSGPLTLFIDRDTNIDGSPAPTGPINIVGVLKQFNSTVPPGFTGYEIVPRSLADITPCALPGACCFADGSCQTLLEADCVAAGGTFFGGACDPNPCPQPGTGACCFANGSCLVLTAAECAAQGGTYQGDNTPCSPNPCPPPRVPICDVAADNADGTPVMLNQYVEVEGIAHVRSGTWNTTTQQFELSDGQCCVSVFGGAVNPVVQVGDRVIVRGTVIQYSGLTELSNPGLQVTIVSSGNPVYGPGSVTTGELGSANGENYEACLIRITCATIISGTWPAAGQNANLVIDDGTGPVTLRIDKETNIDGSPAPTGPIDIVGVGYQFTSAVPPGFTGYQILPRSLDDITPCSVPQPGACCFASGDCAFLLEADCTAQGGTYLGPTTDCDPNPCPQPDGACCFPNGACAVVFPEDCASLGGVFLGGPCDPNPCPQPLGACCFADGSCQLLNQSDCGVLAGQWQGMNTNCDPNLCPQPTGACCFPDGSCQVTTEAQCGTGLWFIFGACEPNPCPQPTGACCYPDGSCIVTLQADCNTGNWIALEDCDPNPCPQPPPTGACCYADGTCQVLTEGECLAAQGTWQGADTDCDPNPCPPPVPVERTTWGRIKEQYR